MPKTMLKILNLKLDLNNLIKEQTQYFIARVGNEIYKSGISDKHYKLWKKFKNATKAKKFIHKLEIEKGIKYFGTQNNIYLSSRLI